MVPVGTPVAGQPLRIPHELLSAGGACVSGLTNPFGSPANVLLVLLAIPEVDPVPAPYVAVAPVAVPPRVPVKGPVLVPVVRLLKFQVAIVVGVVHEDGGAGAELTIKVSEAVSPVSVVSIFSVLVVLLYVPAVLEVTVTAIVQVLFPATVIFEKDIGSESAPDAGEGVPQPL